MAAAAEADADAAQMPFIKNLASSDRTQRTQSLAALQAFLAARAETLSARSAQRLWTGLFYALWMTDRPRAQAALGGAMADLAAPLPAAAAASPWLRAFWPVVAARWADIDALRLDKFLLLVRRVFAAHVRLARRCAYAGPAVDAVLAGLREACFDVDGDHAVALGLRLHVLDVWVDELEREGALADAADDAVAARAFVAAVGAMVDALRGSRVKSVRERACESYDDERLPWAAAREHDDDGGERDGQDDESEGWAGIED